MAVSTNDLLEYIDSYSDQVIYHQSHKNAPTWQKFEEQVGKYIIDIVAVIKAISLPNTNEKNASSLSRSIYSTYSKSLVEAFKESETFKQIVFGPSISHTENINDNNILSLFHVFIGKGYLKDFPAVINNLLKFVPNDEISGDDVSFKTLLQEHLQKFKLGLPNYIVDRSDGPHHDQTFYVSCLISNGEKFSGIGSSKKKAEIDAAKQACKFYKIVPTPLKIKSKISTKPNYDVGQLKYFNKRLCDAFSLPESKNLVSAFLPPRLRDEKIMNGDSHRKLAILGSYFINFLFSCSLLELAKNESLLTHDTNSIKVNTLSNNSLSEIFQTDIIKKSELPFTFHKDFESLSYQVDCLQAMYGLCLFEILNKSNQDNFLKSIEALNWIYKRANYFCKKNYTVEPSVTTIAVTRCQSLGFVVERLNLSRHSWGIKLSHIRTGKDFCLYYHGTLTKKKEITDHLAGVLLKVLDRIDGVYFNKPVSQEARTFQKQIALFILKNIVNDKKNDEQVISFINRIRADLSDFQEGLDLDSAIEVWKSDPIDLVTRASALYIIHKETDLVDSTVRLEDYFYFPLVYLPSIGKEAPATLEFEDLSLNGFELKEVEAASDINGHNLQTNEISNKDENESNVKAPFEANDRVESIEKKYHALEASQLDAIWKTRSSSISSTEEAAIILSDLRYKSGEDFTQQHYTKYLNHDSVLELDLPGISPKPHLKTDVTFEGNTNEVPSEFADHQNNVIIQNNVILANEQAVSYRKVAKRVGQADFRRRMIEIWGKCTFTGCSTIEALDAAHISPYRATKDNKSSNGLLLRADLHRLYDANLISIDPETYTVHVSEKVIDSQYRELDGHKLSMKEGHFLSQEALHYRWLYFSSTEF